MFYINLKTQLSRVIFFVFMFALYINFIVHSFISYHLLVKRHINFIIIGVCVRAHVHGCVYESVCVYVFVFRSEHNFWELLCSFYHRFQDLNLRLQV